MTVIFLLLVVCFVIMFILFYKSRKKLLIEKQQKELEYLQELSQTKSEIRDQTLNHIGRELHDNIGQLLAVAKIHTNRLTSKNKDQKLLELDSVLDKTIQETRMLSHSLNTERSEKFELISFIEKEILRVQATQKLQVTLNVHNEKYNTLVENDAIMIFRIIQEFLSNTLKHSQASDAQIIINFESNETKINVSDNGQGFDVTHSKKGSGIYNIENRIKLLNGQMNLTSNANGTFLSFTIPKKIDYDL